MAIIQVCSSHKLNCKAQMHTACLCLMHTNNSVACLCICTEIQVKLLLEMIKAWGWHPILGWNKLEQTKKFVASTLVYYTRHCKYFFSSFPDGLLWYGTVHLEPPRLCSKLTINGNIQGYWADKCSFWQQFSPTGLVKQFSVSNWTAQYWLMHMGWCLSSRGGQPGSK